MIGRLKDISKSIEGKYRVMFEVDAIDEVRGFEDKDITIKLSTKARKRSLNANAYFHVLVGKIADKMAISKAEAKNKMLGDYGQREIDENGPVMISAYSCLKLERREDMHCVPIGYAHIQGKDFTHYALVRGSHTYNTAEMSHLIEGTIQEAKELGIETLPPAEIERMMKAWQSQYSRQAKNASFAEPQSDWSAIM